MTPAHLALSRQILALPGAPTPNIPDRLTACDGVIYFRDDSGMRWIDASDRYADHYEFVLDLTDPTTGGVMLSRIGQPIDAEALARVIVARGTW